MKLLSLFVFSWVTIFIKVHSVIDSNVEFTKPRFCSSGQHFIFLHSQQVLHTIMSTEGRTTFNERRLREKSFKTLVIRGRLCFDRSIQWWPSSSTQRKREAFHAPVCYWCTCLVKASLATLFVFHLAYFFIWKIQI